MNKVSAVHKKKKKKPSSKVSSFSRNALEEKEHTPSFEYKLNDKIFRENVFEGWKNLYISLNDREKDKFLNTGKLPEVSDVDYTPLIKSFKNCYLVNELIKLRNDDNEKEIIIEHLPAVNLLDEILIDSVFGEVDFLDEIEANMSDDAFAEFDFLNASSASDNDEIVESKEIDLPPVEEVKVPDVEPIKKGTYVVSKNKKEKKKDKKIVVTEEKITKFEEKILKGEAPLEYRKRLKPKWNAKYRELVNNNEKYKITRKGHIIYGADLEARMNQLKEKNREFKDKRSRETTKFKISRSRAFEPRQLPEIHGEQFEALLKLKQKKVAGIKTRGGKRDMKKEMREKFRHHRKEKKIEQELKQTHSSQSRRRLRRKRERGEVVTESLELPSSNSFDMLRENIVDILGTLPEGVLFNDVGVADFTIDTVCWFYLMYTSKDYKSWIASTRLYIRSLRLDKQIIGKIETICSEIWKVVTTSYNQVRCESFNFDVFMSVLNSTMVSPLIVLVQKMFATMCSFFAARSTCKKVFQWTGLKPVTTVGEIISLIFESLYSLWDMSVRIYNGEPVSEVFYKGDCVNIIITELKYLLSMEERTYVGRPVEGYISERFWLARGKDVIKDYEKIYNNLVFFDARKYKLASLYNRFIVIYNEKDQSYSGRNRVAPIGVLIVGLPGIGKSNIIDLVFSKWAQVCGEVYTKDMVFQQNKDTEYHDGYNLVSTPYWYMSELGSLPTSIAKIQGEPRCLQALSLVSSEPYPLNFSQALQKGKFYGAPTILLADTNNENLNLEHSMYAPSAGARRFIVVRVRLRDEYKLPASGQVDPDKARNAPHHGLDLYDFDIVKKTAINLKQTKDVYVKNNVRLMEMLDGLEEVMVSHRKYQDEFSGEVMMEKISNVIQEHGEMDMKYDMDGNVAESEESIWFRSELKTQRKKDDIALKRLLMDREEKYVLNYEECKSNNVIFAKYLVSKYPLANIDPAVRCVERCRTCIEVGNWTCKCPDFLGWDFEARRFDYNHTHHAELNWEQYYNVLSSPSVVLTDNVHLDFIKDKYEKCKPFLKSGADICTDVLKFQLDQLCWNTYKRGRTEFCLSELVVLFMALLLNTSLFWLTSLLLVLWHLFGYGFSRVMVYRRCYAKLNGFVNEASRAKSKIVYKAKCFANSVLGYDYLKIDWNPFVNDRFVKGAIIVGGTGLALMLIKKVFKLFYTSNTTYTEDSTPFVGPSSYDEKINEIEELSGVQRTTVRRKGKLEDIWFDQREAPCKPLHNGDIRQFSDGVYKKFVRYVRVAYKINGIQRNTATHILGIRGNYFVINTHAIQKADGDITLYFYNDPSDENYYRVYVLQKEEVYHCGNDISVIRILDILLSDLTKHIVDGSVADGIKIMFEGSESYCLKQNIILGNEYGDVDLKEAIGYNHKNHRFGLCGLPVFGKTTNTGVQVIGIHAGGHSQSDRCYAAPLNVYVLNEAITFIAKRINIFENSVITQSIEFEDPNHAISFPETVLPKPKSVVYYEDTRFLEYYGHDDNPILMQGKSKLTKSSIAYKIPDFFDKHFNYVPDELYGPPMMGPKVKNGEYISPYNKNVNKFNKCSPQLQIKICQRVMDELTEFIISKLPSVLRLAPYPLDEAINGSPYDDYLRAMNLKASAGYGLKGKKYDYFTIYSVRDLELPEEHHYVVYDIIRELNYDERRLYFYLLKLYINGEITPAIFKSQLKDEPRPEERCENGNTRLFYMTPLLLLIAARSYVGPFYTLMVQFPNAFCSAVGINMHRGAQHLYDNLVNFSPLIMEGDYSGYDVNNCPLVANMANGIIMRILKHFGYNETALEITRGVLTAHMYPVISVLGDLFSKPGLQPSGRYGTAEDNTLRNTIMQMYNYYSVEALWNTYFFDNIRPCSYGDDLLTAVKEKVSHLFNGVVYRDLCLKNFDMKFTPAAKGNEMTPFMTVDEMGFLKRHFVMREGKIVAPLDLSSIYKSLYWTLPSSNVSSEVQLIANIQSMLWEFFLHSKNEQQYNAIRTDLINIVNEEYDNMIPHEKFPVYQDIYDVIYSLE